MFQETLDSRKGNKLLPRTTVLDKLKQDLGGKTLERCLTLIDPHKSHSRAVESWQKLLHKFRQFFLQYEGMGLFDEALVQYDELDALFTQFVLNANVGESPAWLDTLSNELLDWTGWFLL